MEPHIPFPTTSEIHQQACNPPASGGAAGDPECAVLQFPSTRVAEASITLDDVRVLVHIGPTRATFADALEALEAAVTRLRMSDGVQMSQSPQQKAA